MLARQWEERLVQQVENQPKRILKALVNMQYLFFWNETDSYFTEGQFLLYKMRVIPNQNFLIINVKFQGASSSRVQELVFRMGTF